MKDVYVWAYERSASRYAAIRESLGAPDYYRIRNRRQRTQIVQEMIRRETPRDEADSFIRRWIDENIAGECKARFQQAAESDLGTLNEGNYAIFGVTFREFAAWQRAWARN